jgi:putative flippase GtrA
MMNLIKKLYNNQKIRFLFVGGLNTIVGYGTYALLVFVGINYFVANIFSTIIGVFHSYLWNRYFTFKSREKALGEILRFISVYIISFIVGNIVLFIVVNKLGINQYIAGLINLIFTTLISWFGHKYYSFRSGDSEKR